MNPYSASKALWHGDRIELLAQGKQPDPVHVEMVLSDWCNMSCHFCAYRMPGYSSNQLFQLEPGQSRRARNPRRFMPEAKAREIIADCQKLGTKAVQFTGGGEPCTHSAFIDIVSCAQKAGLDTALVTNGSNLVEAEWWPVLAKMAWIRVSVDAGTPETYMRTREVGRGMWDRVVTGIRDFAEYLNHEGAPTVLGAGYVVTPSNWTEMETGVRLLRDLGVHNVRLGLMFNPKGSTPYKEHREEIEKLARKCEQELSRTGFTVINRVSEKLGELDAGSPDFEFCSYQHLTTYIGADLNVYRCCVLAYNLRGKVGSLENQSFLELWRSQEKQGNFTGFDARDCERCQFSEIIRRTNQAIADRRQGKMVAPAGEPPPHTNFV